MLSVIDSAVTVSGSLVRLFDLSVDWQSSADKATIGIQVGRVWKDVDSQFSCVAFVGCNQTVVNE